MEDIEYSEDFVDFICDIEKIDCNFFDFLTEQEKDDLKENYKEDYKILLEEKDKITLSWMNKIKQRMKEKEFKDSIEIKKFIDPILRYGKNEEQRISRKV